MATPPSGFPTEPGPRPEAMTPRRVLVRLPNWLGDLLMARPLLHGLRAALPQATIDAHGPGGSELLGRERLWDGWTPATGERPGGGGAANACDAAIILPPSFSSAWRVGFGVPLRVGFAADGRSWLLTHPVRRPPRGDLHLSAEYLGLGAPLGVREVPLPVLEPTAAEREQAAARLRGLAGDGHAVAILAPGAIYGPAKRWAADRFAALGRRLAGRGHTLLVCGGRDDRAVAIALAAAIGPAAHALAGETTLGEQLALCAGAAFTVSNDSGLAHLSAASGCPTVVIFGSTSSAWTAPLGPRVTVVQHAPVCAPCFRRDCRIGYRCLAAVEVAEVERVCREAAA